MTSGLTMQPSTGMCMCATCGSPRAPPVTFSTPRGLATAGATCEAPIGVDWACEEGMLLLGGLALPLMVLTLLVLPLMMSCECCRALNFSSQLISKREGKSVEMVHQVSSKACLPPDKTPPPTWKAEAAFTATTFLLPVEAWIATSMTVPNSSQTIVVLLARLEPRELGRGGFCGARKTRVPCCNFLVSSKTGLRVPASWYPPQKMAFCVKSIAPRRSKRSLGPFFERTQENSPK
mmetsp:Transcript_7178/g.15807  ORF Transcript_7178/g.15807 Transcript_7178/m.15807 type:complete len:235 (+) Transcript_7178:1327-2031(+)